MTQKAKRSKRVKIAQKVSMTCGVAQGDVLKVLNALEAHDFSVVPTDETLEYYQISKKDADMFSRQMGFWNSDGKKNPNE